MDACIKCGCTVFDTQWFGEYNHVCAVCGTPKNKKDSFTAVNNKMNEIQAKRGITPAKDSVDSKLQEALTLMEDIYYEIEKTYGKPHSGIRNNKSAELMIKASNIGDAEEEAAAKREGKSTEAIRAKREETNNSKGMRKTKERSNKEDLRDPFKNEALEGALKRALDRRIGTYRKRLDATYRKRLDAEREAEFERKNREDSEKHFQEMSQKFKQKEN